MARQISPLCNKENNKGKQKTLITGLGDGSFVLVLICLPRRSSSCPSKGEQKTLQSIMLLWFVLLKERHCKSQKCSNLPDSFGSYWEYAFSQETSLHIVTVLKLWDKNSFPSSNFHPAIWLLSTGLTQTGLCMCVCVRMYIYACIYVYIHIFFFSENYRRDHGVVWAAKVPMIKWRILAWKEIKTIRGITFHP